MIINKFDLVSKNIEGVLHYYIAIEDLSRQHYDEGVCIIRIVELQTLVEYTRASGIYDELNVDEDDYEILFNLDEKIKNTNDSL